MKRLFKNTVLAVLSIVVLGSCNNFLDKMPDQRTETDTKDKISAILVSAYPKGGPELLHEKMSDNTGDNGSRYENAYLVIEQSYRLEDITEIDESTPYWVWEKNYAAIAAANQALEGIASLEDPSICDAQKGEALMCRAYGHFVLAMTFCMPYNDETRSELGLPYSTLTEKTAVNTYERGTLGELYDNILDDITKALPLIDDNSYSQPAYHFNKKAAYTFAAQVNLYMGNFDRAIECATQALGTAPEDVLRDMAIFATFTNSNDDKNQWASVEEPANFMVLPLQSIAGRAISYSSCRRYNHSQDIAYAETIWGPGGWGNSGPPVFNSVYGSAQATFTAKGLEYFVYIDRDAGVGNTYIIGMPFTSEKALLFRAEAYVMKGQYELAAQDISIYYRSLGSPATTVARLTSFYSDPALRNTICKPLNPVSPFLISDDTQEAMIQAVLHIRRLANIQEGYRMHDLKRWGIPYTHIIATGGQVDVQPYDRRLVIQIPEAVRSAGMQANPRPTI